MKKHYIASLFYFILAFFLFTCKDPVFYAISQEVKPIEPRIKGSPTSFTAYNNRMYVASGNTLYAYNGAWSGEVSPGGNILQIASTNEYLYALCSTDRNNDGRTVVRRFDKDNSTWLQLGGILDSYSKLHNIFAAGDILFVLATSFSTTSSEIFYSIICIDGNDTISLLKTPDPNDTGELNGAAFNGTSYFLSTLKSGVYIIDKIDDDVLQIRKDADGNENNFSGIINLQDSEGTILLIARNGSVFTVKDSVINPERISMGLMATGALAIWRENDLQDSNRLLLAGRQESLNYSSTSYKYGYMELKLDINGIETGASFVEPGINPLSSVRQGENERYQSTLGKYPVNHLFQVPADIDSNMITFASTQKNGVWSYRDRNSLYQWNSEE